MIIHSLIKVLCAGLGGGFGYIVGGINWDHTEFGRSMGGQLRVIYLFTSVTLIAATAMTLTSIPERPLVQSQSQSRSSRNLKSPNLPLPPSPPPPAGAAGLQEEEEEDGLYGYQFSGRRYPDSMGHSCSANARLCAGLRSPISPLSPLTPKYGSFISRDNTLTGLNEFASSLGTSYIDSVLIDCYTGQQTPQPLEAEGVAPPLPPGDTPPSQVPQPIQPPTPTDDSQQREPLQLNGGLQGTECLQAAEEVQAIECLESTEALEPTEALQQGSNSGILKRPQSLTLVDDSLITPSTGLENGRRRTVTFSQQVNLSNALRTFKAIVWP